MKGVLVGLLFVLWEGGNALTSVSLTPTDVYTLTTPGYPAEKGGSLPVSWVIKAPAGYKMQINCNDVRMGSSTNKTCRNRFVFREERTLCETAPKGVHFITEKNSIMVDLILGMMGAAAVKCDFKAIPVGSNPNPNPARPSDNYFSKESFEVDSSEHGGPPGRRSTTCRCGWSNKAGKRIVQGKETSKNEYPFMIALMEKLVMKRFCGGAIITSRHVLTAAHCTQKPVQDKKKLTVVIGAHNIAQLRDPNVQIIDVERVYEHAEYDPSRVVNDIAMLVLEKEITFSDVVGPACVSPTKFNLDKKYVRTIGWGKTSHSGPSSDVLLKVDTRVLPLAKCQERFPKVDLRARTQICNYGEDKDSCMGDSGGPVIWVDPDTNRYNLIGLVSYGRLCGDSDPAVNTDVSAFYSWIQQRIRESNSNNERTCHKV